MIWPLFTSAASSLTSALLGSYITASFNHMQFLEYVLLTNAFCVFAHIASLPGITSLFLLSLGQSYSSLRLKSATFFFFSGSFSFLSPGEIGEFS